MTYSFGSRRGRAVLTLQVAHPGTFRVVAAGAPAVAGGSDLTFGSTVAGGIASTALPAGLLMGLGAEAASPWSSPGWEASVSAAC